MSSQTECYYSILEIEKTASADEIKKAYRKMSLKWHPDKNNHPSAPQKFQKINDAYETLGDADKKQMYDMTQNGGKPINIFEHMMRRGGVRGNDIFMSNIAQMFPQQEGMPQPRVHIFNTPNGMSFSMGGGFHHTHQQQLSKPPAIIKTITIDIKDVLVSSTHPVVIERWVHEDGQKKFETETIYVEIQTGIDNGEIIVIKNKGNVNGELTGDIKLMVKIENNTEFKRDGLHLIYNKNITLKESLCGVSFDIEFVNGKTYTINNNAGNIIPPGYKKHIHGMGIKRGDHTGDLIIIFNVKFPAKLTIEDIELIKKIEM